MKKNSVVHFEVPYDDKDRVVKFYSEVFGWETEHMTEMEYVIARTADVDENYMIKKPGAINGGMYKRDGKAASSPVIVIHVDDIHEHVEKVTEAGGKVHREILPVSDMGLYAQVEDTEGNIVGIWQDIKKEE